MLAWFRNRKTLTIDAMLKKMDEIISDIKRFDYDTPIQLVQPDTQTFYKYLKTLTTIPVKNRLSVVQLQKIHDILKNEEIKNGFRYVENGETAIDALAENPKCDGPFREALENLLKSASVTEQSHLDFTDSVQLGSR